MMLDFSVFVAVEFWLYTNVFGGTYCLQFHTIQQTNPNDHHQFALLSLFSPVNGCYETTVN